MSMQHHFLDQGVCVCVCVCVCILVNIICMCIYASIPCYLENIIILSPLLLHYKLSYVAG